MRHLALVLALALCGCSGADRNQSAAGGAQDLESAAIARGMIPDPQRSEVAGLYARESDRLCIVPQGDAYRIGAFVDYGDGINCSGAGRITRDGETLHVTLGEEGCSFDARIAGDGIRFPGRMPQPCARLCTQRASFAGMDVQRLSDAMAEASALRDPRGRLLCAAVEPR